MRTKIASVGALTAVFVLAIAASASALTLGSTTYYGGPGGCFKDAALTQLTSDTSTRYMVPAGGGRITEWSTNALDDTAGENLRFVVLNRNAGDTDTVVGADSETIPASLPTSEVASFPLPTPITVTGGETLGLYSSDAPGGPVCYWSGGPLGDTVDPFVETSDPAAGQTLADGNDDSPPGITLDLAATLVVTEDAGVTNNAVPSATTLGNVALLSSTVTDAGPGSDTITYTDTVPPGLTAEVAGTGSGTCATSGQQVTCTITGLTAGQSAPVEIAVKPTATGAYADTASVALPSGDTDPNLANNTGSATLTVQSAPSPPKCVVPKLKGLKASFAKRLVGLLGCKAGKLHHAHSTAVPKGDVIHTSPGPGTYAPGRKVSLVVSSGAKKGH